MRGVEARGGRGGARGVAGGAAARRGAGARAVAAARAGRGARGAGAPPRPAQPAAHGAQVAAGAGALGAGGDREGAVPGDGHQVHDVRGAAAQRDAGAVQPLRGVRELRGHGGRVPLLPDSGAAPPVAPSPLYLTLRFLASISDNVFLNASRRAKYTYNRLRQQYNITS